jgi:hypothetical protein
MGGGALPWVGRTAVWVAGLRAVEGERADRLFEDRFAAAFVSAAGGGVAAATAGVPPGASEFLAIRTRFFDDQARAACTAGIRQVVLLAAGLDCRAFRLDWPAGVRVFELDLPDVFAFKVPVLAAAGARPRCARVAVAADLRAEWTGALTAGFDPGAATGWLAEGLLPYLAARTSTGCWPWSPGCRCPAAGWRSTTSRRRRPTGRPCGRRPTRCDGWEAGLFRVPALGEDYGRPLPAGVDLVTPNATVLVAARR